MAVVAVTDHVFPDLDQERAILGRCRPRAPVRTERGLGRGGRRRRGGGRRRPQLLRQMPAEVIRTLDRCRIIARYGIGLDTIDLDAATERGIVVTNVPDYCIDEVSDHALALDRCRSPAASTLLDRRVRTGSWTPTDARPLHRLRGRTLGLVGFGRIARALAVKAAALGFRVVATDPFVAGRRRPGRGRRAAVVRRAPRARRRRVDPRAADRREPPPDRGGGARDDEARGDPRQHVARSARRHSTRSATRSRQGASAAPPSTCSRQEPPAPDDPLLHRDDVVITPHAAFYSEESLRGAPAQGRRAGRRGPRRSTTPVRGERRRHRVRYLVRRPRPAHHRPRRRPISTASPNVCSSTGGVRTSSIAPAATSRPSRSSAACVRRGRHLLEMVRRDDRRRSRSSEVRGLERVDQRFASGEVQPRRRLVEDQQLRCGEQRASEEHPLPFALAPRREPTPDEVTASERSEQVARRAGDRPRRYRWNHGESVIRLPVSTTVSTSRSGGISSARTWLVWLIRPWSAADVASPKRGSEHADATLRRLPTCARDAQQRASSRPRSGRGAPNARCRRITRSSGPEDRPAIDAHDRAVELDDRLERQTSMSILSASGADAASNASAVSSNRNRAETSGSSTIRRAATRSSASSKSLGSADRAHAMASSL